VLHLRTTLAVTFNSPYQVMTKGLVGGAATFFGYSYYKRNEVHNTIHAQEKRANKFLNALILSDLKTADFENRAVRTRGIK
jgi:hypothetical protein